MAPAKRSTPHPRPRVHGTTDVIACALHRTHGHYSKASAHAGAAVRGCAKDDCEESFPHDQRCITFNDSRSCKVGLVAPRPSSPAKLERRKYGRIGDGPSRLGLADKHYFNSTARLSIERYARPAFNAGLCYRL